MDFDLTETQLLIKETARKFAMEELVHSASKRDEMEEFPSGEIKKLAELGFMGMIVPEEYGGAGLDTVSYVIALEEISKADASVGVIMSVNNSLACSVINEWGSEDQKKKYLRPLAQGSILGAFALSEPEAGSDASNQKTTARPDGNHYILNGAKNFITSGSNADVIIVIAATDQSQGTRGISAFIVEKTYPGFSVSKKEKKMGIRSSDTVSLSFQDCAVPAENRIGDEGIGFKLALGALEGGRIGIAAQALGIAQACLDASVSYALQRKAFGKLLSEFQSIQFKIAEMSMNINAARLLTYNAAVLKDAGKKYGTESAMAKLHASKIAVECALEAIQIHGGYGYMKEYNVERYLRDAKVTEIYEGTSEIQKIVISRELFKNS